AEGRAVFVLSPQPHRVAEHTRILAAPAHGLRALMYVEGGPEASLYVRAGGTTVSEMGRLDVGFSTFWSIPNVIAVVTKGGKGRRRVCYGPDGQAYWGDRGGGGAGLGGGEPAQGAGGDGPRARPRRAGSRRRGCRDQVLRRAAVAVGVDPRRGRVHHGAARGDEARDVAEPDRHERDELLPVLSRGGAGDPQDRRRRSHRQRGVAVGADS